MLKTNLLAALTMSAALFFTACQKEQAESLLQSNNKTFPMPSNGGFRSLPTMPSVQNGMLKFTDQAHFNEYLAYLDALVMDEPQTESQVDTDTTEFDVKLLQVETNLSFNSLRAQLVADFEALNEEGFATLEEVPATHFIADAPSRSILNADLEYKVGNSVFIYYNANYLIEIMGSDANTRQTVKELRGENSDELHPQVPRLPNVKVHGLNGYQYFVGEARERRNGRFEYTSTDLEVQPTPDCQARTARVKATAVIINASTGDIRIARNMDANFIYDWGDGNTITYNVSNFRTTQQFTYANAGVLNGGRTLLVTVTAVDANNPANVASAGTAEVTISNAACTERDLDAPRIWNYSNNGQWAFRSELKKRLRLNGRGRVTATTSSFKLDNGRWKSKKANRLVVQLIANSSASDCTGGQQAIHAAWPYNAKEAQVVGNVSPRVANNQVNSNHRMEISGVTYAHNHLLIACP